MLGFYNISVVLTYLSLLAASAGIASAVRGHIWTALLCLMISGFLDMWDGKVARWTDRKNARSKEAQRFGAQIDSLCDLVCFGVLPAVICFVLWQETINGVWLWSVAAICGLFILSALIRLAYFNVVEEFNLESTGEKRKHFDGIPTTAGAVIFPLVYAVCALWAPLALSWAFTAALLVTGLSFLLKKIKIKKPSAIGVLILALIGGAVLGLFIASRFAG